MSSEPTQHRPVIVAPTFNNARTLPDILQRLDPFGLDVIVTNDGSTDTSASILHEWAAHAGKTSRIVIVHDRNRGKAAALRSAFARAAELGYTHAITIDTDGQLAPEQVPMLLECSRCHPDALILGCRDDQAADYPRKSFVGRWVSNTLVRWQSGAVVSDSQCGFRVYPLATTARLGCRASRFSFETEVLTRAAWAGVPLHPVEVSCTYNPPHGRVTHFKPWRDSLRAVGMHATLLCRAFLLPFPVARLGDENTGTPWRRFARWMSPVHAWRAARQDPVERTRFAVGLATGVFIANLPVYGGQTLLSLAAARWFRLHPLAVIAGSHASTPPLGPALIVAAVWLGHVLTHGAPPTLQHFDPRVVGYAGLARNVIIEWTLGGIVCGVALAAATFAVSRVLLQWPAIRAGRSRSDERTPAGEEARRAAPVPTPDS
jgi:uncharacterized protein (DUF2062 family)